MLFARRWVAVSLALLGGCGAGTDANREREPPPVEETVFGDMVGTVDKARGVEDMLQKQKEERDRQSGESN